MSASGAGLVAASRGFVECPPCPACFCLLPCLVLHILAPPGGVVEQNRCGRSGERQTTCGSRLRLAGDLNGAEIGPSTYFSPPPLNPHSPHPPPQVVLLWPFLVAFFVAMLRLQKFDCQLRHLWNSGCPSSDIQTCCILFTLVEVRSTQVLCATGTRGRQRLLRLQDLRARRPPSVPECGVQMRAASLSSREVTAAWIQRFTSTARNTS